MAPQFHVSILGDEIPMGTHHMLQVDVVTPAEETARQFLDSACSRDTPQTLTQPLPSCDWQSSDSSTASASSDETSSSISNDMLLTSGEENSGRTGSLMISSKIFK